ncbi:unnamed protein product [Absidia cylindrospora]
MKFLFAFATALITHQALFVAATCKCTSNDVACAQSCADSMFSCLQGCTTNEMDSCTNACLAKNWPVTENDEPMRAPLALVKRDDIPAEDDMGVSLAGSEASLSSHHGEEGREGEGRGGHGSHGSKKDGPESGFMGGDSHPPMMPEPPREEFHRDNDMHGDFNKGKEGFQHHNMAASTNVFTIGTTATMALTVMGAFLVAA